MELIGKGVKHKMFGVGTITKIRSSGKGTYIFVVFSNGKSMEFIYPTCFSTFLQLLDENATSEATNAIRKKEEEDRKERDRSIESIREQLQAAQDKAKQEKKSKSQKTIELRPFASVESFCNEYKKALVFEILHLKKTGGKRERIFDGKQIETKNGRHVYSFETEDELSYPEGTPISLWKGNESRPASILGCEEFSIIIATEANLGTEVPSLEFSAEPWRLLEALVKQLENIPQNNSEIVRELICDGTKSIDYGNRHIATGQSTAVEMSQKQPITFIWGPPGTGKTQTLANIALTHIERGNRVLMLSYSNVSVDGAIMRVHKLKPDIKPGTIVRYGYAKQKEVVEHKYLSSYNLVLHQHPELLEERRKLSLEKKKLLKTSQRYVQIGNRLTQIKKMLSAEEKVAVQNARFVATTVSKAVVDNTLRESQFDVVIFDEASMAYIPQIVFSASLAGKHFVCMGDFRQLPPIVQSGSESILNADIFQYCGVASAVDGGRNHKWLCMLDTQYRMQTCIADFASQSMYGGLLRSAEGMDKRHNKIVNQNPAAGHALAFADLSGMMSVCTKTGDGSRVNVLSALISYSLALEAAKSNEVGIITPYQAQSRLLRAMARDTVNANKEVIPIICATVHQFQGSEKDVIVYDAVDCYRMPYPGKLLTSTANNYANRLFNVALTRARGKFIGVANVAYMNNKNLPSSLMFEHMIRAQRGKKSCLQGNELLHGYTAIGGMSFFDSLKGKHRFLEDIAKARSEVRVDIPDIPAKGIFAKEVADALRRARSRGVKVYVRAENKRDLSSEIKALAIENHFVANPIAIIDRKFMWFGMPDSEANFKSEGITLITKYRPIIRFEGPHTARAIYSLLEMENTTDQSNDIDTDEDGNAITETFASYVKAKKRCSSCGRPMKLCKGNGGRFFLGCSGWPACENRSFIDAPFVEKYFHRNGGVGQRCPQCKFSLEAKEGKFGVYIQCCGSQKHKYKFDEI